MVRRRLHVLHEATPWAIFIPTRTIDGEVRILICPQCRSTDMYYEAGLITGYKYRCKRCNYVGAFVIEQEIDVPEEDR